MSSAVQNEINKTQQEINALRQQDEYNQAQANASWSMGDYGQGSFVDQLQNSPLSKKISELYSYMNSLRSIQTSNFSESDQMRALNEIKNYHLYGKNVDRYGGRNIRRKRKSVKRKTKRSKKSKRNTRRKK